MKMDVPHENGCAPCKWVSPMNVNGWISPFSCFLALWTDVESGFLRDERHRHKARREKFTPGNFTLRTAWGSFCQDTRVQRVRPGWCAHSLAQEWHKAKWAKSEPPHAHALELPPMPATQCHSCHPTHQSSLLNQVNKTHITQKNVASIYSEFSIDCSVYRIHPFFKLEKQIIF